MISGRDKYRITIGIRELACCNQLRVCLNEESDCKNQLAKCISQDKILECLRYLHPFQCFSWNEVSQIYKYQIYIWETLAYLQVNLDNMSVTLVCIEGTADLQDAMQFQRITALTDLPEMIQIIPEVYGDSWVVYFATVSGVAGTRTKVVSYSMMEHYICNTQYQLRVGAAYNPQVSFLNNITYIDRELLWDIAKKLDTTIREDECMESILAISKNEIWVLDMCTEIYREYRQMPGAFAIDVNMNKFIDLGIAILFKLNDQTRMQKFLTDLDVIKV